MSTTLPGQYIGLGYDNAPDMSNLLALVLGTEAPGACEDVCDGLPTIAHRACMENCKATGKTPQESFRFPGVQKFLEPFRNILIIAVGVVLVIVALALLTK